MLATCVAILFYSIPHTNVELNCLNNGLCIDPDYYTFIHQDYTVGLFDIFRTWDSKVKIWKLYFSSFARLRPNQITTTHMWLNDNVIDILGGLIVRNSSFNCELFLIPTTSTRQFFGNKTNLFYAEQLRPRGKILMPHNMNDNHWVLAVADVDLHEFTVYNPAGANRRTIQKYFKLFMKFLEANNKHIKNCQKPIDTSNWKTIIPNTYPLQRDTYNCGLFTISYVWTIAGNDLEEDFNTVTFRSHLQNYLLHNSESVENMCYICGVDDVDVTASWLECDVCKRWFHTNCLQDKSFTISKITETSRIPYCCALCVANGYHSHKSKETITLHENKSQNFVGANKYDNIKLKKMLPKTKWPLNKKMTQSVDNDAGMGCSKC